MSWVACVIWNGRLVFVDDRGQVWALRPDWELGFVGEKWAEIRLDDFKSEAALIECLKGLAESPF